MDYATLKTISRQPKGSRENRRLRKAGTIPGSVTKLDKTTVALSIARSDLQGLINKHGRSAVFKLAIDRKKPIYAMIRDIEVFPLTDNFLNISLFEVSLKEEIKAAVDLKIINDEGLIFAKLRAVLHTKSISVAGLPNNIPDYIELDASTMKNGDNIYLKDIALPEGITTDTDPETMVLSISSFKAVPAQETAEEEESGEQEAAQE